MAFGPGVGRLMGLHSKAHTEICTKLVGFKERKKYVAFLKPATLA
jgi:hypothetical protein